MLKEVNELTDEELTIAHLTFVTIRTSRNPLTYQTGIKIIDVLFTGMIVNKDVHIDYILLQQQVKLAFNERIKEDLELPAL